MKCLDLKGGLTDVSPSEKLPFPITDVFERGPKTAATMLSSMDESTSVMDEVEAVVAVVAGFTPVTDATVFDDEVPEEEDLFFV